VGALRSIFGPPALVRTLVLGLFFSACRAGAEPVAEVHAAIEALRKGAFSWESTAHQRSTETVGDSPAGRSTGPIEVEGKSDLQGVSEITLRPSKAVPAPVTVYLHAGAAVGHTPLGWLTRTEMREALGTHRDELLPLDGTPVRLHRAIAAAREAMLVENPLDEVSDLLADVRSWPEGDGVSDPVGKLSERAVERRWGDNRALSAPEIDGTVTFAIRDGILAEYRVRLEIGYPARRGEPERRTVTQWTTRITFLGTTQIEPPAGAREKLEE
jgi:hypothetical protein